MSASPTRLLHKLNVWAALAARAPGPIDREWLARLTGLRSDDLRHALDALAAEGRVERGGVLRARGRGQETEFVLPEPVERGEGGG